MIGGVMVGIGVVLLETTMAISVPITIDETDRYLEKLPRARSMSVLDGSSVSRTCA